MWKAKNKSIYLDYLQFYSETLEPNSLVFDSISKHNSYRLDIVDSSTLANSENSIRLYFNNKGVRIHLTGSFFADDNINDNIAQATSFLKSLNVLRFFKPFLISRIDIAENVYGQTLKDYYIENPHNAEVTEIKNNGKLNTIYLGKRGAKAVLYRCYDKRADIQGKNTSIKRFGTVEYVKHEYELKRDIARKYDLDNSGDLKVGKIEKIYDWIKSSKRIHFVNPAFIDKPKVEKCKIIKPGTKDLDALHKMIKGIYQKNFDKEQGLKSIQTIQEQIYGVC